MTPLKSKSNVPQLSNFHKVGGAQTESDKIAIICTQYSRKTCGELPRDRTILLRTTSLSNCFNIVYWNSF